MGTEWYLADTKHQRAMMLGKGLGSLLSRHLREAQPVDAGAPIDAAALRAAVHSLHDATVRDGLAFPTEADKLDAFAAKLWAFCAVAGWSVEIRNDIGDYDDDSHRWPTVASWYIGDALDPDPLAEEQARWEAVARETMQCST